MTVMMGCSSMFLLVAANMGSLGDDTLLDSGGVLSHKLARERIQEELAKLEASKVGHAETRESALHELAKLEGANDIAHLHTMDHLSSESREQLAKLQDLDGHDHSQMKLSNSESRERVQQELARLAAEAHADGVMSEESKSAHEAHEQELQKLDLKHQILNSKADHEDAKKRVMGELAKLEALHSHDTHHRVNAVKGLNTKTASAAKGLNLKKDAPAAPQQEAPAKRAFGGLKSLLGMKVADAAIAEDSDAVHAVNLMQTGAAVERKNIMKRKKHQEL